LLFAIVIFGFYICNMLDRIVEILKSENLSAAGFADEIGVQRSIISHILNKRNKPSLEFAKKTLQRFTSISPEWLIMGTGDMYKTDNTSRVSEPVSVENVQTQDLFSAIALDEPARNPDELVELPSEDLVNEVITAQKSDKYVSQILIFYSDSTYGVYKPEK